MLRYDVWPKRLMVQFHTFADPDGIRLRQIHERLAQLGYRTAWSYGVMLTAWERDERMVGGSGIGIQ
jgi:hypothetical protein